MLCYMLACKGAEKLQPLLALAPARLPCLHPSSCLCPLVAHASTDPSARVRQMVEALLLRQLAGRRLLTGNLVPLPVFGQHALFMVEAVDTGASATAAEATPNKQASIELPPPVMPSTSVRLLLGNDMLEGEAGQQGGQPQGALSQGEEWPALAVVAAAEALGCLPEDAGPVAAQRAAAAGLASRGITFDDLGGANMQASVALCCVA